MFSFIILSTCISCPLDYGAAMSSINRGDGVLETSHISLETLLQEEEKETRGGSKVSGRPRHVLPSTPKGKFFPLSYPHYFDGYLG